MWALETPWWELLLRAVVVYATLLVLVRLSGKRTLGQFTAFDVIVLLLISEAAQGPLTGGDDSVPGGLIVITVLIALNYGPAWIGARSRVLDQVLEGHAVVLMKNGQLFPGRLLAHNIPPGDFDEAMRSAGILDRAEVHLAVLETDGTISFFRRTGRGPGQVAGQRARAEHDKA